MSLPPLETPFVVDQLASFFRAWLSRSICFLVSSPANIKRGLWRSSRDSPCFLRVGALSTFSHPAQWRLAEAFGIFSLVLGHLLLHSARLLLHIQLLLLHRRCGPRSGGGRGRGRRDLMFYIFLYPASTSGATQARHRLLRGTTTTTTRENALSPGRPKNTALAETPVERRAPRLEDGHLRRVSVKIPLSLGSGRDASEEAQRWISPIRARDLGTPSHTRPELPPRRAAQTARGILETRRPRLWSHEGASEGSFFPQK